MSAAGEAQTRRAGAAPLSAPDVQLVALRCAREEAAE